MKYDFDTIISRENTNSLKWKVNKNELPMWVADMDFKTAPEIQDAIIKRAEHGIFGYSIIPDEWYEAYINWWQKRHNFKIEKEWLMFCTGIIPAISSIIRKLTTASENILVQTPIYGTFFKPIIYNGRQILESSLKYNNGTYSIDFADLEQKLSNPQTTMMILCNPHNPIGKIWDKQTLEYIGELCYKYNVIVLSDEIHCDLTDPKCNYTPFASVSKKCKDNSIICISPTKTFNIAGLATAAVVVPNENLRYKVQRGLSTDEVSEPNNFAIDAAIAAFTKGEVWLDELRDYIYKNKCFVSEFLKSEVPQVNLVPSNATYLLWLDFTKISSQTEAAEFIREKTGLYLSKGSQFGNNGKNFVRMNIACSRETLKDGLNRLKKAVLMF